MRIAMLSSIAWATPPLHYGPWQRVTSLLTEALLREGVDVTLFATGNSRTAGALRYVCPRGYEEDAGIDPKVWECLHIANCFEHASEFDLVHNHFDFAPLPYSGFIQTPVLTTIHGFSSRAILPVYEKYNGKTYYVSISDADRSEKLDYLATVYHGIDIEHFTFRKRPGEYLLFYGRFHKDKGAAEAIEIARKSGRVLHMAGIVQDEQYFKKHIEPCIDGTSVLYLGMVGPDRRDTVLGNAYALLHPINFAEPFGLSVVEAMACGTPVIAFSKGSLPEIITDGRDGFLVHTVDEAVHAVNRIRYIDRHRCRATVQNRFTAQRMAREYCAVYEKILGNGGIKK